MSKQIRGTVMLLLAAMIWGAAFTAQTVGMDYVGPFTFQAIRQAMGALVLLPVILLRDQTLGDRGKRPRTSGDWRLLLVGGLLCGGFLFCACTLQQLGLLYTTPGKSGFITALYVILVPLLGIFAGKAVSGRVWISVAIALAGMYLLCIRGTFSLGKGELLTLGCALCFAGHILVVDRISPRVDGVRLSALQFAVSALISTPFMLLTETPEPSAILACWLPLCYTGILSCGVSYTLQILAQRDTDPTLASIAMSMESVFAAVFGWILLGQAMDLREILGSLMMFFAIVLAQVEPGKLWKRRFRGIRRNQNG